MSLGNKSNHLFECGKIGDFLFRDPRSATEQWRRALEDEAGRL